MRLRVWFMTAFLIVMLLPAAAIYTYYLLLSHLDQQQNVQENLDVLGRMGQIESRLQERELYQIQSGSRYEEVQKLADESVKIKLYRYDGIMLFTSAPDTFHSPLLRENQQQLYSHLYELQKNHRSYSLKKPVFDGSRLIGFYQITVAREQWLQGVSQRTFWLTAFLLFFFLILYGVVIYIVHRKIARPIRLLMKQMTSFAEERAVEPIPHRTRDEIGELIAHFAKMREQVLQTREAVKAEQREKEYIVASLSHDLKTPLTVIRAYAELLKRNETASAKERAEHLSILLDKTDYMKQLVDDLTMYSAMRSADYVMELTEVDGEELFEMLLSGYEELCANHGFRLQQEMCVSGTYLVNVPQMIRVVDNLMNNGNRHTRPQGAIGLAAVSAACDLPAWVFPAFQAELSAWRGSGVVLLVQNEGEAIPVHAQEKVFEPFYQMDGARTKKKNGQSGLGLSIARIIMNRHGGDIRLWSEHGYGTLVACRLPEHAGEAETRRG